MTQHLLCEFAWLGGDRVDEDVLLTIEDGRIEALRTEVVDDAPSDADWLRGVTIPGLANTHSHAFQRALRGRTQVGTGSFWTWREQMYELATALDPDAFRALARATFGEMALAGITCVGEFHYVHHAPDGTPYENPNELGHAILQAAADAGIRVTLLDTCYLHGGIDRFRDRDAHAWAERVEGLPADSETAKIGAAIHSVRAVDPDSALIVAQWASARPLHAHVSEQPKENEDTLAAHGVTPTTLLANAGAISGRFTAVHATHMTADDISLLGDAGATICLCPTTERDLADGIGPARKLANAGAALAVGSDSHAVIDILEEARAIELDERLATNVRGNHRAVDLLRAATRSGHTALGWDDAGALEPGAPADLAVIGTESAALAGTELEHAVESIVFAGTARDVKHVMVGGRWIVRDGTHTSIDVPAELKEAVAPA